VDAIIILAFFAFAKPNKLCVPKEPTLKSEWAFGGNLSEKQEKQNVRCNPVHQRHAQISKHRDDKTQSWAMEQMGYIIFTSGYEVIHTYNMISS
jgi:hypothetical protein